MRFLLLLLLSASCFAAPKSGWDNQWGSSWNSTWRSAWGTQQQSSEPLGVCCGDSLNDSLVTEAACIAAGGRWFSGEEGLTPCLVASLSADTLDFGQYPFDPAQLTFTIYSLGLDSLRVDSLVYLGAPFSTDFSESSIATGDSLVVTVDFLPTSYATYGDWAEIYSNAPSSPDSVWFTGIGALAVGSIVLSAASVDTSDFQVACDFSGLGDYTYNSYLLYNGEPVYYWIANHTDSTGWIRADTLLSAAACTVSVWFLGSHTQIGDSAMLFAEGFDVDDSPYPKVTAFNDWDFLVTDTLTPLVNNDSAEAWYAQGFREHGNILYDTLDPDSDRRWKTLVSGWWGTYNQCSVYVALATSADGNTYTIEGRLNDTLRSEDGFLCRGAGDTLFVCFEDKTYQCANIDRIAFVASTDHGATWPIYGMAIDTMGSTINWITKAGSPVMVYDASDTPPYHLYFEAQGGTPNCNGTPDPVGADFGLAALFGGNSPWELSVISHPDQPTPPSPIMCFGNDVACAESMVVTDCAVWDGDTLYLNGHALTTLTNGLYQAHWKTTDYTHLLPDDVHSCIYRQGDNLDDIQFFQRDGYWYGAMCAQNLVWQNAKGKGSVFQLTLRRDDSASFSYNDKWWISNVYGNVASRGYLEIADGIAHFVGGVAINDPASIALVTNDTLPAGPIVIGARMSITRSYDYQPSNPYHFTQINIGAGDVAPRPTNDYSRQYLKSGYSFQLVGNTMTTDTMTAAGTRAAIRENFTVPNEATLEAFQTIECMLANDDSIHWFYAGTDYCARKHATQWSLDTYRDVPKRLSISQGSVWNVSGIRRGVSHWDYICARKFLDGAQPTATVVPE